MEHRSVGRAAAAEVMPLHKPGKPASFTGSDDVHKFVRIEDVDHDLVAGICSVFTLNPDLAHESCRSHIRFFEMTRHWFRDTFGFHELDESKLHGVVAVFLLRLSLDDNAGTRLNDGDGNSRSVVIEQLRHPDFLAQ